MLGERRREHARDNASKLGFREPLSVRFPKSLLMCCRALVAQFLDCSYDKSRSSLYRLGLGDRLRSQRITGKQPSVLGDRPARHYRI